MTNKDAGEKTEAQRAKEEDQANKFKRKVEGENANWVSPEHNELAPSDVGPEVKTVPSNPDPENNAQLEAIRKAREQKKA